MKNQFILVNFLAEFCLISNLMHKILIYLHIIHLLKSSTCFEHYPAHLPEVYVFIVYMQPLVSSLSAGDCLVHRLRKNSFFRFYELVQCCGSLEFYSYVCVFKKLITFLILGLWCMNQEIEIKHLEASDLFKIPVIFK